MTQKDPEKFLALIDVDGIRSAWAKGDAQWHENEWKEFIKNIRRQTIEECLLTIRTKNIVPSSKSYVGGENLLAEQNKLGWNLCIKECHRKLKKTRDALQQKLTSNE